MTLLEWLLAFLCSAVCWLSLRTIALDRRVRVLEDCPEGGSHRWYVRDGVLQCGRCKTWRLP